MAPLADLITTGQAAEVFGVNVQTMRRWADAGQVPSVRMPSGRRKFHRSVLERMVADLVNPDEQVSA